MQVTVKLFANFRTNRFAQEIREYDSAIMVGGIVEELGIPVPEVGIVFINGRNATMDQHLNDGDTLSLFPLVGGG